LSAKSVQDSEVSEVGVQLSDELPTGVHVSLLSDCAVHVSLESGTAPHPKPIIVPTAPADSTPIIAIDMTFDMLPTDAVPLTPVIA
jgi:hypothetical protein